MIAFLLAAAITAPPHQPTCPTTQPGPAWVCHNGGWLPPGHPDIPVGPPPPPPFEQQEPAKPFRLNFRYTRGTTDVRIVGTGQLPDGVNVLFALCNTEGDGCFFKGMIRMFLTNATAADWTDNGPY